MREKPSLTASIIGQVNNGDQVSISSEKNDWVNIRYQNETAWISSQFVETQSAQRTPSAGGFAFITNDGTNIRTSPSTISAIIVQGTQGERYPIIGQEGDWYKISLASGNKAYVASWLVSTSNKTSLTAADSNSLKGKVIVLDPGHGGKDGGTTGTFGTLEKHVTLQTAKRLAGKLQEEGASVVLTRSSDQYISLPYRTDRAYNHHADAFISLHYDGSLDTSAAGFTAYYYHPGHKLLAESINLGLTHTLPAKNRGTRNGDYFVLRENNRPAVLLELGYLTNLNEESSIVTSSYQNLVTTGVYRGLVSYFSK
ncbi:hypothetical protein BTO30_03435 [Domibacillus antri]|uniref:SH3b domain-containing protein n=1 Tax=Domibacillus antri TaxID=1714264 RepID=A0A1Q8Q8H7_9BACI|nr:hypothetical protein BTO30_03435 [Domibacillus antri]